MSDSDIDDLFWNDKNSDLLKGCSMPSMLTKEGMIVLSKVHNMQEGSINQPIIVSSDQEFKQVIGNVIAAKSDNVELSVVCNFEGEQGEDVKPYNTAAIKIEKSGNDVRLILVCLCLTTKEEQSSELDYSVVNIIKNKVENSVQGVEKGDHKIHVYYQDSPFINIDSSKLRKEYFTRLLTELEILAPVYLFGCAKDLLSMPNLSNNLLTVTSKSSSEDDVISHEYQMPKCMGDLRGVLVRKKTSSCELTERYRKYKQQLQECTFEGTADGMEDFFKRNDDYGQIDSILEKLISGGSKKTRIVKLPEHASYPGYWFSNNAEDNLFFNVEKNSALYLFVKNSLYNFENIQLLSMEGLALLSAIYAKKEENDNQPVIVANREGFFKVIDFMINKNTMDGATLVMVLKNRADSNEIKNATIFYNEETGFEDAFSIKVVKKDKNTLDFTCLHPGVAHEENMGMATAIEKHLDGYLRNCRHDALELALPKDINIYRPSVKGAATNALGRQSSNYSESVAVTGDFLFKDAKNMSREDSDFLIDAEFERKSFLINYENCAAKIHKYTYHPSAMKSVCEDKSRAYYLNEYGYLADKHLVSKNKKLTDVYAKYPNSLDYMKHFHGKYIRLIEDALADNSPEMIREMSSKYDAFQMSYKDFEEIVSGKPCGSYNQEKAIELQDVNLEAQNKNNNQSSSRTSNNIPDDNKPPEKKKKRNCCRCFFREQA